MTDEHAFVRAASEEEAREKVRVLDMDEGFDTSSLVNCHRLRTERIAPPHP